MRLPTFDLKLVFLWTFILCAACAFWGDTAAMMSALPFAIVALPFAIGVIGLASYFNYLHEAQSVESLFVVFARDHQLSFSRQQARQLAHKVLDQWTKLKNIANTTHDQWVSRLSTEIESNAKEVFSHEQSEQLAQRVATLLSACDE